MIPPFLAPERVAADQRAVVEFSRAVELEAHASTYLAALRTVQSEFPPDAEGPALVFDLNDPRASRILADFQTADDETAGSQFCALPPERQRLAKVGFSAGMQILDSYDTRIPPLIDSLVGTWIFALNDVLDGGSFWFALGSVWLAPTTDWTPLTYAENILHESTHQATFLVDMVQGVFNGGRAEREATTIVSPIRRVPRRYDFAFHAAAVAAVLGDFHRNVGDPERAEELTNGLRPTLLQLREKEFMLEPAGRRLLDELLDYVPVTTLENQS